MQHSTTATTPLDSTTEITATEEVTATAEATPAAENAFAKLGLVNELLQAITDLGYSQPTEVQLNTIPKALPQVTEEGTSYADLMVSSRTGSGKTAAFLLPILNTLAQEQQQAKQQEKQAFEQKIAEAIAAGEEPPKKPRRRNPKNIRHTGSAKPKALILCPTRELAQQVSQDAIALLKYSRNLRVASIVGGTPYYRQVAQLQGAAIIIATPGRLLDLQRSNQLQLDEIQFLVLDEADRMLDLGFSEDLNEVNLLCKQRRQTQMFSATFPSKVQQLAANMMRSPIKVEIASSKQENASISQQLHWADNLHHKRDLLNHWLRSTEIEQAIVFASTKIECDDLARDLQAEGFSAQALHGDLNQGLRNRRLTALRNGKTQILVATDVAARGIDVPTISHVFNFGLPMKAEDYTHRIGRTGRAGRTGIAVTFAEFRDRFRIFDIERYNNQAMTSVIIETLEPRQRFPQDGEGLRPSKPAAGNRRGAPRGNNAGGRGRSNGGGYGKRSTDSRGGFGGRSADSRGGDRSNGGSFGGRSADSRGGDRSNGGGFGGRSADSRGGDRSNGGGFGGRSADSRGEDRGSRSGYGNKTNSGNNDFRNNRGEKKSFNRDAAPRRSSGRSQTGNRTSSMMR